MRKPVMEEAWHRVPLCTEMLGVTAAEVLRRAYILWRLEGREEIIILRTEERTFAVDGGFADHARLMDIEILEGVVRHTVGEKVTVTMAIRATGATSLDLVGEEGLAARDLSRLG